MLNITLIAIGVIVLVVTLMWIVEIIRDHKRGKQELCTLAFPCFGLILLAILASTYSMHCYEPTFIVFGLYSFVPIFMVLKELRNIPNKRYVASRHIALIVFIGLSFISFILMLKAGDYLLFCGISGACTGLSIIHFILSIVHRSIYVPAHLFTLLYFFGVTFTFGTNYLTPQSLAVMSLAIVIGLILGLKEKCWAN